MKSLRDARAQGKLGEFAKEHERDAPGDEEAFNRALKSMAQTSLKAPKASSRRNRGD